MTAFILGVGGLLSCVVFISKARSLFTASALDGPLWFASKVMNGVVAVLCLILALIMGLSGLAFLVMAITEVK